MTLILRWFHDNGERHRAFFRQSASTTGRELVVACRDWEYVEPDTRAERLEDLSEDTLIGLARHGRARAQAPHRA